MGIDQACRIAFEETDDFYNETRPEYPDELVEEIVRLFALKAEGPILEIGCEAVIKNTNSDNLENLYLTTWNSSRRVVY